MKQKFKVGDKVVLAKNSREVHWRGSFYDVAIKHTATVTAVADDGDIGVHWNEEFFWGPNNVSSEKESESNRWFSPSAFERISREDKSEYED